MKVIFIGAQNPETIRMIDAIKMVSPEFNAYGFIDNDVKKHGTLFHGFPVFGGTSSIPSLLAKDVRFVNLITGSTIARYQVTLDAVRNGATLTNFIHPSVNLKMTHLGVGNYIQEGVITQAEVEIGDNSSIHMASLIGHESKIGNTVFIAHAVSISGCCEIGDGCFIGTNATVLPRLKIGKWSIIGAGAVVTKNIPDYSVAIGNPARVVRRNDVQHENGKVFL
jgi:sugar O-acyltransferase (sialic acid O-acetyltransferase NeuD family)